MIGNEKIHIETLNDCIVFNDLLLQESQTKGYFWKVFLNMLGYISRHTIKQRRMKASKKIASVGK